MQADSRLGEDAGLLGRRLKPVAPMGSTTSQRLVRRTFVSACAASDEVARCTHMWNAATNGAAVRVIKFRLTTLCHVPATAGLCILSIWACFRSSRVNLRVAGCVNRATRGRDSGRMPGRCAGGTARTSWVAVQPLLTARRRAWTSAEREGATGGQLPTETYQRGKNKERERGNVCEIAARVGRGQAGWLDPCAQE